MPETATAASVARATASGDRIPRPPVAPILRVATARGECQAEVKSPRVQRVLGSVGCLPGREARPARRNPSLELLDLSDPGTFDQGFPHELFRRLRREAPVAWHAGDIHGGPGYWVL